MTLESVWEIPSHMQMVIWHVMALRLLTMITNEKFQNTLDSFKNSKLLVDLPN